LELITIFILSLPCFFSGTKYYAFHIKRTFFNHHDTEALLYKLENGMLKIRLHLIEKGGAANSRRTPYCKSVPFVFM